MRSHNMFLKIGVLVVFAILMSAFVGFHSGVFDKYLSNRSHQVTGDFIIPVHDTDKKPAQQTDRTRMSSSKSMIMTDYTFNPVPTLSFGIDTPKLITFYNKLVARQKYNEAVRKRNEENMMVSTKSGPILKPVDMKAWIDGKEKSFSPAEVDSAVNHMRATYLEIIIADSLKRKK